MALDEPTWVPRLAVLSAHFDQLQEHGGEQGLREQGSLLDAALARPRNKFAYGSQCDLADLAAAYAFAIAKTAHPFLDGNKRTGLVVAVMFLLLNGHTINHPEGAAAKTMLAVAEGAMTEDELAAWFREGMTPA